MKVPDVLVKVFEPGRLLMAWQQVRKNAGAAGIDQMTVEEFAQREEPLLALIHDKLKSGNYRFQPARRVLIPKQGTSRMRKLGIPVVMDLKSFFDEIPHGLILKLIRCKVADEQLVTLLARLLKAGVMVNGGRLKRRAKAVRKAHRSPRCFPTSS